MASIPNAGRTPLWVRRIGSVFGITAVLAITGLTACADAPAAPPTPTASASLSQLTGTLTGTLTATTSTLTSTVTSLTGTVVHGLLWTSPVGEQSASRVIGPAGGSLSMQDGIKVVVPRGAVSRDVRFSVTRLPGIIVAYDFQPHGIKFAVPVQIEQPTAGTGLLGLLRSNPETTVRGAYFAKQSLLDQLLGTAVVTEFRPASISADRKWIRFTADHFSGYMVSMD